MQRCSPPRPTKFYREDLRIPMEAAGPRGLEALLIRPSGTQRYPLALISHGTPRDESERAKMTPYRLYAQAIEFARRGACYMRSTKKSWRTETAARAEPRKVRPAAPASIPRDRRAHR